MPPRSKFKGLVEVHLWGRQVGAAAWNDAGYAVFQYAKDFATTGLPIAPLMMPLNTTPYQFKSLWRSEDFQGLPGMLADALPDRWGNLLIQRWLTDQGRDLSTVTPFERLCFVADRAMGALEFKPAAAPKAKHVRLHVDELLDLSQRILTAKSGRAARLSAKEKDALAQIILVGSSVGGNRAKALIAWDPKTDDIRAGDIPHPANFEPWIIKFDETGSGEGAQPKGYGRIEYAYHLMAKAAGINMADCRLWEEHGRAHFMTKRFDRVGRSAKKLHYQSLSALAHLDRHLGPHSYEDAFRVLRQLRAPAVEGTELFRRTVFNVAARNQDDHTKNFGYLMDETGHWHLAPAFDVTWAYNPMGEWTQRHQLSLRGKTSEISRKDLLEFAKHEDVRQGAKIIDQVRDAVSHWPKFAAQAGVPEARITGIEKHLGHAELA